MNTEIMLPRPLSVVANEDYTLSITFNNGEKRLFNMTPYLIYPTFEALKAINLFMRPCIKHNTVVWTEDIDMAPENLYLESSPYKV